MKGIHLDQQVLDVIQRAVEEVAGTRSVVLEGDFITSNDVASPMFLLPALLVSASEYHAIARAAGAETAFHVVLESDAKAFLGFRVEGLKTTSLAALVLPVIGVLRRASEDGPSLAMDKVVQTFGEWLVLNKLEPEHEIVATVNFEPSGGSEPEMGNS
jgi:hypothetical protein